MKPTKSYALKTFKLFEDTKVFLVNKKKQFKINPELIELLTSNEVQLDTSFRIKFFAETTNYHLLTIDDISRMHLANALTKFSTIFKNMDGEDLAELTFVLHGFMRYKVREMKK